MANSSNGRPPRRKAPTDPRQAGHRPPSQRQGKRSGLPRSRKRSGVPLRLLTMLLVVVVFLLGVAIFFKVAEVQVVGNSVYSAEQVAEASGICTGDNLLTLSKASASGQILARLPYVESVQIERVLPDTVVITVQESDVFYAVATDGGTSWLMNSSGKMLEAVGVTAADYPVLLGITAQSPEAGAQIACEETEALSAALEVLELLDATDYVADITEVNVEKPYDIVVWYQNLIEVHLGGTDELSYKLQYFASILQNEQVQDGGVIDLTLEEKNVAIFKPWGSTQDLKEDSDEISSNN